MNAAGSQESVAILVFEIGGRRAALRVADVERVVRAVSILPLPGAPAAVEGVIDVRGQLVPVLDLRGRFRLAASPLDPDQYFVLALAGSRRVALRVDRARELANLPADALADPRAAVTEVEHLAGIARLPDGLVLIYDLRAFLDAADAVLLEQAIASQRETVAEPA